MFKYPAIEFIKQVLDYNKGTGIFRWRRRPTYMFPTTRSCAIWNGKYAGKIAGYISEYGYREITINDVKYGAHRLAWAIVHGEWPPNGIDHENGKQDDNWIDNLRLANQYQNLQNQKKRSNNTSGYIGVSFENGKWAANITVDYKSKFLGYFTIKEDAYAAYLKAKTKYHTFNPIPRV